MQLTSIKHIILSLGFAAAVLATGCTSSQQLIDPKLSLKQNKQPVFIDDVTLGNNSTNITINTPTDAKNRGARIPNELSPNLSNSLLSKYAGILGVVPQAIKNFGLYSFIDEWYGVRYRLGGTDKKGIDCSAFVQRLYEDVFGVNLVRTAFQQFHSCRMVFNMDSLKEGDLVFFHINRRKRISHVGIYLRNNYFVHASSSQGVMISNLNDDYWARYYAGAGSVDVDAYTGNF